MCSFGLVVYNFYFLNFLNLLIYYFLKKQNALVALEGFFFFRCSAERFFKIIWEHYTFSFCFITGAFL